MSSYQVHKLNDWAHIAPKILKQAGPIRTWCFFGDLGAGKTTLIKALCQSLGVQETVTSPTFTLMHPYDINDHQKVYHFDFYRIENLHRIADIGFESFLYSEHYVFVEWPQIIQPLLQDTYFNVQLLVEKPPTRTIYAHQYPSKTPKKHL